MFVGTFAAIDLIAAMMPSGLASAVKFKAEPISRGEIPPTCFECTVTEILVTEILGNSCLPTCFKKCTVTEILADWLTSPVRQGS